VVQEGQAYSSADHLPQQQQQQEEEEEEKEEEEHKEKQAGHLMLLHQGQASHWMERSLSCCSCKWCCSRCFTT
jgi:hypothetical protein